MLLAKVTLQTAKSVFSQLLMQVALAPHEITRLLVLMPLASMVLLLSYNVQMPFSSFAYLCWSIEVIGVMRYGLKR